METNSKRSSIKFNFRKFSFFFFFFFFLITRLSLVELPSYYLFLDHRTKSYAYPISILTIIKAKYRAQESFLWPSINDVVIFHNKLWRIHWILNSQSYPSNFFFFKENIPIDCAKTELQFGFGGPPRPHHPPNKNTTDFEKTNSYIYIYIYMQ